MIIRSLKNKDYTVINNRILNDDRLTWRARGLAAYLLTKPDNWKIHRDAIADQSPDGIWVVRGILKELEACGYLTRTRVTGGDGRFTWEIVLHETPVVENQPVDSKSPVVDLPPMENPPVVDCTLVSTVEVSTELVSTEKPLILDDRAETKIVVAKLESAGVILNALLVEQYADLVSTFGLRPVLDGITAATLQSKQHSFKYVAACVRNIYDGTSRSRPVAATNGHIDFPVPALQEVVRVEPTIEERMWKRLASNPHVEKLAHQWGKFEGEVFVPRTGEYRRARQFVDAFRDMGIQIQEA